MNVLLLLLGCTPTPAPAGGACTLVSTAMLPLDEDSPLGFPAQRIVDLGTAASGTVTYADRPASTVYVEPVLDVPTARFEDWEADGDTDCLDRVAIDGHYLFHTDDGLFDESGYVPFTSWGGDTVDASVRLDPGALGGAWTSPSGDGDLLAGSTWGEAGHAGGVVQEIGDGSYVEVARW